MAQVKGILTLALGGLRHRPLLVAMTVLVVALAVGAMVSMQGTAAAYAHALKPLYAGTEAGGDWVVVEPNAGPLPSDVPAVVSGFPEVAWVLPRTHLGIRAVLDGEETVADLYLVDPTLEVSAGVLRLMDGELPGPENPGVALRGEVARRMGLTLGDTIIFFRNGKQYEQPLVGLTGREGVSGANWGVGLIMHAEQAVQLGLVGPEPTTLLVNVTPETDAGWSDRRGPELREHGADIRPPKQPRRGRDDGFSLLYILSVLGPFLGVFLIQNSLAITMRQRAAELALWRVLGATRRQLVTLLLAEGVAISVAGWAVGVIVGLGLTRLLLTYLAGFQSIDPVLALEGVRVTVPWWILAASLVAGVVATLAASLRPVLAVTQVEALSALQRAYVSDPSISIRTLLLWTTIAVLSAGTSIALQGRLEALLPWGLCFAAMLMLLPGLLQRGCALFPVLPGGWGVAITLGARRIAETRKRSAGGARALMLVTGLLVGFGAVAAATWRSATEDLNADTSQVSVQGALTGGVKAALEGVEGVDRVNLLYRGGRMRVAGQTVETWAFDLTDGLPYALTEGETDATLRAVGSGNAILLGSRLARQLRVDPGDEITATPEWAGADSSRVQRYTVAAIYPDNRERLPTLYQSLQSIQAYSSPPAVRALVYLTPGIDPETVAQQIGARVPGVKVVTREQRWESAMQAHREGTGTILAALYLLAVFGTLGIIQTSVLSAVEQRRELALLRAGGATPWQAMLIVLAQCAIPGLAGALVGAAGGLLLGQHLILFVAGYRGADLETGVTGWFLPVLTATLLSLLATLPAVLGVARMSPAMALRKEG